MPLKVIVGGHTGLEKRTVLRRICEHISDRCKDLKVAHYSVEDNFRVNTFIGASPERQASTYLKALECVLAKIRSEAADTVFLSMHYSFYAAGQFVSPFSLDLRNDPNDTYMLA